jgi:hypothetical protein
MTLELTTEEVELLYRALRDYRMSCYDEPFGDDRDDWFDSEVKRINALLNRVMGRKVA